MTLKTEVVVGDVVITHILWSSETTAVLNQQQATIKTQQQLWKIWPTKPTYKL